MRSGLRQQAGILCLVLGCHLAAFALTVAHSNEPTPEPEPETITPPTIVGIMLPPPVAPPQPKPKPLPEPKPQPKPKPKPKPLPKAPPSEKAVSAPPVEPPPPPAKTAKAAPPKAAPAAPTIQPPSAEAQGLSNKAPLYPQLSRKKKEQGTVLLLILVKADGTVGEIKLKTSSGFTRLDQAAKQAVKRWQFQPALKDGKAIDFWYELPLKFRLNQG
ncbi:energy transducer TonB [Rheinheimera riviphila]|uniref:Protein TonB n=1 Tax=Rheinheimera riviphila TaxID=1834037 RepID=A0A437QLQ1_9GAMM|nr:energy transducer TonB [Rheinheimera riviphila]RVU35446.1 energy transducer TonB [Rheinheimera riviphila]